VSNPMGTIMKLARKVLLSFGAIMCCLFALAIASPYWLWYPAIPWASFTVDGQLSKDLLLYWHRSGRTLVVIRHSGRDRETYFVNVGDPKSQEDDFRRSFVASCADSSIFVNRLFAAQNHEQLCQPFFVVAGESGDQPTKKIERGLVLGHRTCEFYADDGKRITARW